MERNPNDTLRSAQVEARSSAAVAGGCLVRFSNVISVRRCSLHRSGADRRICAASSVRSSSLEESKPQLVQSLDIVRLDSKAPA